MLPATTPSDTSLKLCNTEAELNDLKKQCPDRALALLFWASWDQSSDTLKGMMEEMPKVYKSIRLAYVDCDESDLVDVLDVDTVQSLVVLHPEGSGKAVQKFEGIKPEVLTQTVQQLNTDYLKWYEDEKKRAFRDIESNIATAPFFIFVKGSKEEPKCKFTRRLVENLAKFEYDYKTFNILKDERIRQWLKVYSKWPTFPQAFINQKFVGGIDVIMELIENDEFDEMVPQSCKAPPVEVRIQ